MTGVAVKRPVTILFWTQHLLGVGHLMRSVALADACAQAGMVVHIASGGPDAAVEPGPGVALHQLPAIRSADDAFSALVTPSGEPVDDTVWRQRAEMLAGIAERERPDVVVLEHYPFGRRAFRHEIAGLIDRVSRHGAGVAVSVRDILVDRKPARWREALEFLNSHVDGLFVHGDPDLVPFGRSFPLMAALRSAPAYTGYVDVGAGPAGDRSATRERRQRNGEYLFSSGGGPVGAALRDTALDLAASAPDRAMRIRVGGSISDAEFDALQNRAAKYPLLNVERNRPDFRALMARCACSVSQAGYNTVVDILTTGAPAVLVPFAAAGETEQTLRAQSLEDAGHAVLLRERDLSVASLARAIGAAGDRDVPRQRIRLDGAARFAAAIGAMPGRTMPGRTMPGKRS